MPQVFPLWKANQSRNAAQAIRLLFPAKQPNCRHQAAGEPPAGNEKLADIAVHFVSQRHLVKKRSRRNCSAVVPLEEVYRLFHANAVVKRGRLKLHAYQFLDSPWLPEGVDSKNSDGAVVRLTQPFYHLHRGRLARAIRAQYSENLAFFNTECDIVHGRQGAVPFDKTLDFNNLTDFSPT